MAKYLLLGTALACLAGPALAAESAPTRYTIEQLMASDSIGGLSWSPDDTKLIFTSNRTGIANIYEMPSSGGPATALTHSTKENVSAIGYFTHDDRILISTDQGGKHLATHYVREPHGTPPGLTPAHTPCT